jgi:hypothetical protein
MSKTSDDDFPSAKECMKTIAVAEAEKASEYMRRQSAAEAEKRALMERFEKPPASRTRKAQARESNNTACCEQRTHGGSGHSVPEYPVHG